MPSEPGEHASVREELIDLEVRTAFTQRTVHELDALVRTLYTRVEALEKEVALLRAGDAGPPIGPANEPPPHY